MCSQKSKCFGEHQTLITSRRHTIFKTRVGWMAIQGSNKGITRTCLPELTNDQCVSKINSWNIASIQDDLFLKDQTQKIQSYFDGDFVDLNSIVIDTRNTIPFFETAWRYCRSIPIGETRTYKWLATNCGNSKASRYAGRAMAKNKLPIIIPCHRVIGSDGTLKGFGGSNPRLNLKSWLLDLERSAKYQYHAKTSDFVH